eukprot:GGOE01046406.1.p1 GENE.GGOE01046406.1~~GGOE01046406.1.p1  ORF type:complete len:255 (-),score=63.57 GGOE01046406.1:193-957(-)
MQQRVNLVEPIPPPRMHHNDYELYIPSEALDDGPDGKLEEGGDSELQTQPQTSGAHPHRPQPGEAATKVDTIRIFAVEPEVPSAMPTPSQSVRPPTSIFAETVCARPTPEISVDIPKGSIDSRDSVPQLNCIDQAIDNSSASETVPRPKVLVPDLPESQEVNFPRTADVKQEIRAMKDEHEAHAKEVADLHLLTATSRERTMQALLELRQLDCEHSLLMHQLKVAESSADWFRKQRETLDRVREAAARKRQRQQ